MTITLQDELLACASALSDANLRALIEVLRDGAGANGSAIRRWSSAIGSISHEDAEQMRRAVEDCERVEPDGW